MVLMRKGLLEWLLLNGFNAEGAFLVKHPTAPLNETTVLPIRYHCVILFYSALEWLQCCIKSPLSRNTLEWFLLVGVLY